MGEFLFIMDELLSVRNVQKALFDIKPVDEMGRIDVARIYNVQPVVVLRNQKSEVRSQGSDKLFFGTWDEAMGVKDLALINSQKAKKKAPTDAISNKLMNSVGAARSAGSPARHLKYSLSWPKLKSRENVDNQKPRFDRAFDSVEDRGFAPLDSQVTNRGRHYASPTVVLAYQEKLISQDELEKYLNSRISIKKELTAIGARVEKSDPEIKPRYRPILAKPKSLSQSDNHQAILSQINQRTLPEIEDWFVGEPKRIYPFELTTSSTDAVNDIQASPYFARGFERVQPEIESWIRYAKDQSVKRKTQNNFKFQIPRVTIKLPKLNSKKLAAVVVVGSSVLALFLLGQYGISVKNEVRKESSSAVTNLEQANEYLKVFEFEAASNNFGEAYEKFSKAGDNLNFMGASITSLFAELPGAGKLKSAKNLVEAGRLLAEAGKSMSEAVNSLSETGAILRLSTLPTSQVGHVDNFGDFKKSLTSSSKNLSKVSALLSDVSVDALPEDKRETFLEFQSKLPELEGIVSDAVGYASFLERFLGDGLTTSQVGATSAVKYLILFQNDSELRPTGGFPGTYAVVTFKDGRLADFMVDDIYNLDGQLKENIIPPKPLQHITPNWGMRDANWFIDFSVSAQKTMEFFKKEAGYGIDGVITVSPRMISDILKVVGPIEMPEYDLTIDNDNFLSAIQAEVEYGDNREQPKKVVLDMAPKLLEKIYSSDPGKWLDIFNVFISGLDKKDVLMYFKDLELERFVASKGFGGLVNNANGDYLMITFTNIKGSKTDRVTDNAVALNSKFETLNSKPVIIHKLTITRQHNGGSTEYGFYNKQNPAYVRVLVPKGSELLSISGNSDPKREPLINYSDSGFEQDDDLTKLESSFIDNENEVDIYSESGKTGFAFWLITNPGKQKTVELEYAVPFDRTQDGPYGIYIQKQPGLNWENFEFKWDGVTLVDRELNEDLEIPIY